jgi:DNA modification methylase
MNDLTNPPSLTSRVTGLEKIYWRALSFIQDESFKDLLPEAKARLKASIIKNNFAQPFYVWRDTAGGALYCLDGRHRSLVLEEMEQDGYQVPNQLPAIFVECRDKKEAAELVIVYSSIYAKVTEKGLLDFMQAYDLNIDDLKTTIDLPGFDEQKFDDMFNATSSSLDQNHGSLLDRFLIPPFSIFDTRQGYWQDRKKQWHSLGIRSQETREDVEIMADSSQSPAVYHLRNVMRETLGRDPSWEEILQEAKAKGLHVYEGASIFDPVLAEVCYKWFCPIDGDILDPFAGGSVRGIVAGVLDYNYVGVDLRPDQVAANEQQWQEMVRRHAYGTVVKWLTGDSGEVLPGISETFDFLFSCPPYHDLEQYSDDPRDLSNMPYDAFLDKYQAIIRDAVARLRDDRFACFVVSEIRDKAGYYRNFVSDTIQAFQDAGMHYYNEIILVNVAGSLPIRVGRQFQKYRKVGRTHQNILVFYKGDPKRIAENFPEIDVSDIGVGDTPAGVEQL